MDYTFLQQGVKYISRKVRGDNLPSLPVAPDGTGSSRSVHRPRPTRPPTPNLLHPNRGPSSRFRPHLPLLLTDHSDSTDRRSIALAVRSISRWRRSAQFREGQRLDREIQMDWIGGWLIMTGESDYRLLGRVCRREFVDEGRPTMKHELISHGLP